MLAYILLCLAALVYWAVRTVRLRRAGLYEARGWLVPAGIALLFLGLLSEETAVLIGVGAAFTLIGEFFPRVRARRGRNVSSVALLPKFERWSAAREPVSPDFELYIEERGARVRNVGSMTLFVHGWSPSDENGWLPLKTDDGTGQRLQALHAGEFARLDPWPASSRGVRVWYAREDGPTERRVFRADWEDMARSGRELN